MAMIEVSQLSKRYGSLEAVGDLSFSVERGTVVGFLGPNGAGKSTTLKIMAGFIGASGGRVRIDGHDIVEDRYRALEQLGYMPETSPLYPEMRVAEYLRFRAELKRVPRGNRTAEIERVLERAKARDMADVLVDHLSKGYRQRVGLADALLGSPPLLILDEPTAGLDPNQIRDVRTLVRELGDEHTVLLSTHILSEVEAICDRAIVIDKGRLVAAGSLDELYRGVEPRRLRVIVAGDATDALAHIRALPSVKSARAHTKPVIEQDEPRSGTTAIDVELSLDVAEGDDPVGRATEELIFALAERRVRIRSVAPVSASLEQVFSRLTERDDREEGKP